jgi:hypothetical protein
MRKISLFISSMTMIVAGLYLVACELFLATRIFDFVVIGGGATFAALGAYLLWEEFIDAI